MATITASTEGGNWNATTAWEGGKVPGSGDDVVLATGSGAITVSAAAACRSLDASAYKAILKINEAITLAIGTGTSNAGLAMKLGTSMSLSGTGKIEFKSTSGTVEKIFPAGREFAGNIVFNAGAGKWQFEEAVKSNHGVEVNSGELKTNGQTVKVAEGFKVLGGTVVAGASVFKCKSFVVAATATFTCGTSVIELVEGATPQVGCNVAGGTNGSAFNVVIISVEGTEIVGSNTFKELQLNTAGQATATKVTKESKQTIEALVVNGKSGSLVKMESTVAGKAWQVATAQAFISVDFVSLKDSHATGAAEWYAGKNSTNVSGNEGWKFIAFHRHELKATQGQFTRKNPLKGALVDDFNRINEAPLSHGIWSLIHGALTTGAVSSQMWKASSTFAEGEDAAYYNAAEYENVSLLLEVGTAKILNERWFSFYFCLTNPGTAEISGYRVRCVQTNETGPKFEVILERIDKGTPTTVTKATEVEIAGSETLAFTFQGGAITVWKRTTSVSPWTELLQGQDTTYRAGFIGIGAKGNIGTLDTVSATTEQPVSLSAERSHTFSLTQAQSPTRATTPSRTLSVAASQVVARLAEVARALTTVAAKQTATRSATPERILARSNGQIAARGATALSRTLSAAQPQSPGMGRSLSRTLGAVAAQAIERLAEVGRTLVATAAKQTPTRFATPERTLTASNAQAPTREGSVGHGLSVTQAQSVSRVTTVSRTLGMAQGSAISFVRNISHIFVLGQTQVVSSGRDLVVDLGTTQASTAIRFGEVGHVLPLLQTSVATRQATVTRTLSVAASSAVRRSTALTRALTVGQGSGAHMTETIEGASHESMLAAEQGQGAVVSRTPTRHLGARGTSSASLGRALSRTLRCSQGASASPGRGLVRQLAVVVTGSATVGTTTVHTLRAPGTAEAGISRGLAVALHPAQSSGAVLEFETTIVPLPPHVILASSSGGRGSEEAAVGVAQATATAGAWELTSSVGDQ